VDLFIQDSLLNTLEGLLALPTLNRLSIEKSPLTTLKGLPELPALKHLNITQSPLTSLLYFPSLSTLESINFSKTHLTSLEHLTSVPFLKGLDLLECQITTLKHLPSCLNLSSINLRSNRISSARDIQILETTAPIVEKLNLYGNPLNDLTGFPVLPHLADLDLNCTNVPSLVPLSAFLHMKNFQVSSPHLTSFVGLLVIPDTGFLSVPYKFYGDPSSREIWGQGFEQFSQVYSPNLEDLLAALSAGILPAKYYGRIVLESSYDLKEHLLAELIAHHPLRTMILASLRRKTPEKHPIYL